MDEYENNDAIIDRKVGQQYKSSFKNFLLLF